MVSLHSGLLGQHFLMIHCGSVLCNKLIYEMHTAVNPLLHQGFWCLQWNMLLTNHGNRDQSAEWLFLRTGSTNTNINTNINTDPDPKPNTDTNTDPGAKANTNINTNSDPKPNTDTNLDPKPKTNTNANTNPNYDTNTNTNPNSNSNINPNPNPNIIINTDPVTKRVCGGPAAHSSKTNKQARLVERKVCFISDASSGTGGGQTSVQRPTRTLTTSGQELF